MEQNTGLKTSDYYFDLPQELIAQDPLEDRAASRLLVMNRRTGEIEHRIFSDITEYLQPGDTLVLNDTKVIPARLLGTKEQTGANVEILLLKRLGADRWETLVRPGRKLKPGARVTFGDGSLKAVILDILDEGNRLVEFQYDGIFEEVHCKVILSLIDKTFLQSLIEKSLINTRKCLHGNTESFKNLSSVLMSVDNCDRVGYLGTEILQHGDPGSFVA